MSELLAAYCKQESIPCQSADDLLMSVELWRDWLSQYSSAWNELQKQEDGILRALHGYGFEIERSGGGCLLLSRYFPNGSCVWVTCLDGGGLPDNEGWMICTYGKDIDDIRFSARSDNTILSLDKAASIALDIAECMKG